MEDRLFRIVTALVTCPCKKLRLGTNLYIEPDDEEEIEKVVAFDFDKNEFCAGNSIVVKYERASLAELRAQYSDIKPVSENDAVSEQPAATFEDQVMQTLQGTSVAAKAEPPEEFFTFYMNPKIVLPVLLLFLVVNLFSQII